MQTVAYARGEDSNGTMVEVQLSEAPNGEYQLRVRKIGSSDAWRETMMNLDHVTLGMQSLTRFQR